jgi:hypothetical protein
MLEHSNAFIPMMNDELRQCLDDYNCERFSVELQISVKPNALADHDIKELKDHLYVLIFAYDSNDCIILSRTAPFTLKVQSANNRLLYKIDYSRFDETPDVIWDDRRIWLPLQDEYTIELSLYDGRDALKFWHWLESSVAPFWYDVEIKGFFQCDRDPKIIACCRKGNDQGDVFVSTLDMPSENENWYDGTNTEDSISADWFSMNIEVHDKDLWQKISPYVLQIAAVNLFER